MVKPPLVLAYGPPGCGKTSDAIWAAPGGLFVGLASGLAPSLSLVGYEPPEIIDLDVMTGDMVALRDEVRRRLDKSRVRPRFVVVDDLSMIAGRTERMHRLKYKDGRQLYGAVRQMADDLFDDWRSFGMGVLVGCHEDAPVWKLDDKGNSVKLERRGLPQMPGRASAPNMIKAFDLVYRVERRGHNPTDPSWPYVYRGGPHGPDADLWDTKDRWHVANGGMSSTSGDTLGPGALPMNLGEILRSVEEYKRIGFEVPRAPGCEHLEPLVEWGAATVLSGQSEGDVLKSLLERHRQEGHPMWVLRWLVRDVRARIALRRKRSEAMFLSELGIPTDSPF